MNNYNFVAQNNGRNELNSNWKWFRK